MPLQLSVEMFQLIHVATSAAGVGQHSSPEARGGVVNVTGFMVACFFSKQVFGFFFLVLLHFFFFFSIL